MSALLLICVGNPLVTDRFPNWMPAMQKAFLCDNTIMETRNCNPLFAVWFSGTPGVSWQPVAFNQAVGQMPRGKIDVKCVPSIRTNGAKFMVGNMILGQSDDNTSIVCMWLGVVHTKEMYVVEEI